jgi:hypothetical protein
MEVSFDAGEGRLRLEFGSTQEIEAFLAAARRESGFLVTLPTGLRLHDPISVEMSAEDDSRILMVRVAQVFDKGFGRFGTAFLVDEWPPEHPSSGEPEVASSPEPPLPAAEESDGLDDGEMRGVSPIHAIKQMNPRQRAMLAMKASRTQRRILLRDNSPQVLQNLLANPRIDSEEVLQIARSSHVVAPILQHIATDTRWNGNQELLALIARHPKTPSLFASRLMPSLRTSDLRTLAKMSSGLKEMTRKAALREYLRRTGQRG